MKNIDLQMQILQENLCELRKIAGWTAEKLGDKLGFTKQTVSNIETSKVQMSRVQYIAIRAVFHCEVAENTGNTTLAKVMSMLFNMTEDIYRKYKESIHTALVSIASTAMAGVDNLQLYVIATTLLAPIGCLKLSNPHSSDWLTLDWLSENLKGIEG